MAMAVAFWVSDQMMQGGRLEDQGLAAGGAGADHQVVSLAKQLQPHGLVQVQLAIACLGFHRRPRPDCRSARRARRRDGLPGRGW